MVLGPLGPVAGKGGVGMQEKQPVTAGFVGAVAQLRRPALFWRGDDCGARSFGDPAGLISTRVTAMRRPLETASTRMSAPPSGKGRAKCVVRSTVVQGRTAPLSAISARTDAVSAAALIACPETTPPPGPP